MSEFHVGPAGVPVWHQQAMRLADVALTLAERAAALAAECASVAAAAHQQIETVRLLIESHQPVPAETTGDNDEHE